MHYLLLPIIILRLLFYFFVFGLSYLAETITPYKASLLVFIFLILYSILFIRFNQEKISQIIPIIEKEPQAPPLVKELKEHNSETVNFENLSVEELRTLEEKNTALLEAQPNHRDLLINQALVEYYLGNIDQYQTLLDQAQSLDPNSSYFK